MTSTHEFDTPQFHLARFSEIGLGNEYNVLPPVQISARTGAVLFPLSSPELHPVKLHLIPISLPRFSHFNFPEANLHGFRLLNVENFYFNDVSLVENSVARTQAQIANLFSENIDSSSWPSVRSKSGRFFHEVIDGVLFIGSNEPSNFGSWLFRFLPKLLLSRAHATERPIFVCCRASWMRDIINLAIPGARIIEHEPALSYRLKDFLMPSLPAPDAFLRAEIQTLLTELLAEIPHQAETPSKIYLSRRAQASRLPGFRALENEPELVERLQDLGFVEFIPEAHPIRTQIDIISRARVIICPGGSGLFGCLFARSADLIIDIEANNVWHYAHANILAASGRPFTMAVGHQLASEDSIYGRAHSNWRIDIDTFIEGIKILGVA